MSEVDAKPFFDVKTGENMASGHIDGVEVFRLSFSPESFVENFHKYTPLPQPPESIKAIVRSHLEGNSVQASEEEINAAAVEAVRTVYQAKISHIATRIAENLDSLLLAIMEDAIKAYAMEGTIFLNEQAGKSLNVAPFKDAILKQYWSLIRDLAGIRRGGARQRKGFAWSEDRKAKFYKTVQALPKYGEKPIWQFLLDELVEAEFDAEAIEWLKAVPGLKEVSKGLIDTAIKTWRKYLAHENWNEMKPEDKPRAFEFRHALSSLGYPLDFAHSTLEAYYHQGKSFLKIKPDL
jgi:hypothetical protein